MSWVIGRYLFKSGNNNIINNIGKFNKFSCKRARLCKIISNTLLQSNKLKKFKKNKKIHRYEIIDKYVGYKQLYKKGYFKKKFYMYEIIYMDMWGKQYSKEIIKKNKKKINTWKGNLQTYGPIIKKQFIDKNKKILSIDKKFNTNGQLPLYKYIFIGIRFYKKDKHFNDYWWNNYSY